MNSSNHLTTSFMLAILILVPTTSLSNTIPSVTGVIAQQRGDGSGVVDVHFSLYDAEGDLMSVRLFLSEDGGATFPIECLATTPPPGSFFQSGQNRYLLWDALADYPGHEGDYLVRVQVDDGQVSEPGDFVLLPSGTFFMGAPSDEPGSRTDERPQHWVTLTHDFYLQSTEVTNQQYADLAQWALGHGYCTASSSSLRDALDGSTQELLDMDDGDCEISFSGGLFTVDAGKENHPVMKVTWYGSAAYCDWLSLYEGLPRAYDHTGTWTCNGNSPYTATGYRLPTEAEWEYACRAETTTPFNTGDCLDAGTEANYNGSNPPSGCPSGPYEGWKVEVGSYPPNAWGLYDMHGNVFEWCNDWYLRGYYSSSPGTDPVGGPPGSYRVLRGGGWYYYAVHCRSARRHRYYPYNGGYYFIGFRPARSAF